MDINNILIYFDELLISLEYIALIALVLLSAHQLKPLLLGGSKDIRNESDSIMHSCFITAFCVAVFHISNSFISQKILNSGMQKMELRQAFYFAVFMFEFFFILAVFTLHKIRKCDFTIIARTAILLGVLMCFNVFTQYQIHGVYDSSAYNLFYRIIVLAINISTLALICFYPSVVAFKRLVKTRKLK